MAYIKLKDPTAFIIKKQVIQVEKLVGQKNKFKEVVFKKKIKLTESLRREETEESLEKYEDKGKKVKGFSTPRLGFLDSIKNFLFSVLFGALALKLLPYLPQLKGVLITTLKIGNFAIEFAGTILNAMVTFVDKVYGIIDFGKQQAKILGGDSGVKNYEKMLGMSNKVINTMLIAGMLFSDLISLKAQADSNQNAVGEIGETIAGEIKKRQGFRAAIQAAGRAIGGVAKSAGIVLIVGLAASLLGELSFQQRKFTKKLENDVAYQLKEANSDPNPITRALKLVAYNAALPGLRYFNFISTGVGTLLDIIGAPFRYLGELVNLGIMSLTGDASGIKKQRENLGKLDARIREQIREVVNTLSLGTLAKEKGSFGSLYGSSATTAMGYASGGAVTREGQEAIGGVITRTGGKRAISRTFEIPMSPLNPGADVGGQMNYVDPDTKKPTKSSNIETFFPNPKDSQYINSYEYLTGSYNVVSSGEFLKPFLQMPIKMIMGNGSSEGDYNSLASSVNNLFVTILRRTLVPGTKKSLADELGFVDIFSWARDSIRKSMIDPVNEILQSLKEQFMLKSGAGPGLVKDAGATPSAESEGIQDASISAGEMDLFTRMVYAEAGGEGKTGMALVARAILNRAGLIQSGKVGPGTFSAKSGSITDVLYGPKQFSPIGDGRIKNKLSDSQISQSKDAITLAQNPAQLMSALKSEGLDDASIKKLIASTGFRNYDAAKYDASQDVNEVKFKRHTFNTAGNAGLAVPQSVAIKEPPPLSPSISSGTGGTYGRNPTGTKTAGDLGKYIYQTLRPGPDFSQVSEHPNFGGSFRRSYRSWHNVDRAVDIGGFWPKDQVKILAKVEEFNSKNNVRPVELLYGKPGTPESGSHGDHVHVAYKEGGPVNKTDYALTHPGEYVIDADSVKLFGIQFYDIINKVEMVSQRKNASIKLISILSQYTPDGFVNKDYYTYKFLPPEVIMVAGLVFETASSSGFGGGGGGDDDPSKDGLEQR
tara:strand:- start:1515 stop:4496 length:2982 start_codon:yes stop_codon:yes gene_type:complete